ncbi:MAG: hypothetical protein E7232_08520 [Lachnospiraceae bacterium]|nr:hypothetical protein [Lachnospiraceae bacterium]
MTGELGNKIDSLWEIFWNGGITNPLDVVEVTRSAQTRWQRLPGACSRADAWQIGCIVRQDA